VWCQIGGLIEHEESDRNIQREQWTRGIGKDNQGKRRHPAHFLESFQRFLVPQKASALERKSLVAQGTLESHPYRRTPFRLIIRPILHVRKEVIMGEKKY
jgi:hypothetical protein